jgi:hypothetical protein
MGVWALALPRLNKQIPRLGLEQFILSLNSISAYVAATHKERISLSGVVKFPLTSFHRGYTRIADYRDDR